jgi:amino acid adenylation domain-containing protein
MLFHRLEAGSSGVDVEQCICELHETLDPTAFDRAWRLAVSRHAILRTRFVWENGEAPRQEVLPADKVPLRFRFTEFDGEHAGRRGLEQFLAADRQEGFPTLEAPLLRVALLKAGPALHWWVVTFHHLLLDGRALVLLFKEVHEIHDALVQGHTPDLPTAPAYRGYIDWLQTLDGAKAQKFWREQLKGVSSPTLLPLPRPVSSIAAEDANAARGELACRLDESTTAALRAAAARHQVTMNTMVQAAWAIVLHRYTGENDIVFGAVRACRHIPVEGAGAVVGMFINTVPVRVRLANDVALGAWLRGLREQWVALRDFEHTPLMQAVQGSDVAAGRALFETLFNYQEPSWDTALRQLGGPWASREFDIRSQPNYPLAVDGYGGATLMVKMFYDRRRFADDAIARLLGHLRTVLEALAADRSELLGALPLLPADELAQITREWNPTPTEYPHEVCAHAFVEACADDLSECVAVTDTATSLTYGELNRRANRVARRLQKLGVGPDVPVAVCMERSAEMLVAWLAVLKAGGAFVPLDPKYPAERLAFQLADSAAPVLLTQARLRASLPATGNACAVLDISADGRGFESEADTNLPATATPRNLAYVIYTSGSTGQPKGVQIEHRALMNLVTWHQRAFAVTCADRATQLASPAFDASVWEVWPYLTAGASVHLPDEETRVSPAQLWRWMAEHRITLAFMPTPLAEAAMNEAWPAEMTLRALLTGGDKLKRQPPRNFPCVLINNYGPTENTVVSTSGSVSRSDDESFVPTLGRPVANTRCYVLDAQRRPVPAGVPGELYVGGESLARGYHNRPELTAEKFVADPFDAARRVYRTGDLVRWTAEGEIEFLGRIDGQVKVRGCRIELGEIEATLQAHPAIRESVVLARPDDRGQMQLAAYALPQPGAPAPVEREVMDFLRAKLPAYMVPAALAVLEAWPLTPNGKIDRNALPLPVAGTGAAAESAAPSTPVEAEVARVWSEILGRAAIGRNDNFFDLGGHSLLAAQVVSRLNHAHQAALTVRAVFDQPTVAGLARELESRRNVAGAPARSLAQRAKRRASREEAEVLQPS